MVQVSDSRLPADDLFGFAARIAMGHALNRAKVLDAPAVATCGMGPTRKDPTWPGPHDVAVGVPMGIPTHVVPLRPSKHGSGYRHPNRSR